MVRGKSVKIVISADGTCSIDALNFVGPACQAATQEITALLGGAVTRQQLKPEVWLRDVATQRQQETAR